MPRVSDIIAYWNGPGGTKWAAHHADIDRSLATISETWLAAIAPTGSILDIGCGHGTTTRMLAAKAPRVLGVDVSAPLIEVARANGGEFVLADAATHAFGAFDLVASRFGVMFFDDPVAAFANLRKVSPRLCFVCWRDPRDNPWASAPMVAVRDLLPPPTTPFNPIAPGPFAFADDTRVRDILTRAGFGSIDITRVDSTMTFGATVDDALAHLRMIGPFSRALAEVDAALADKMIARAREVLAPVMAGSVWLVTTA